MVLFIVDPVVMNRFALWAVWTGSLLAISLLMISIRYRVLDFQAAPELVKQCVGYAMLGLSLLSAGSLGLAFFPPPWYQKRLVVAHSQPA